MKKLFLYALLAGFIGACEAPQQPEEESTKTLELKSYPDTRKDEVTDNYHGTEVADPYRWLENDTAAEVEAWVTAQNEVTEHYLAQIPFRNQIKDRLTEIWDYPKQSAPFKEGDLYFFYKNNGLQNQSVLYVQQGLDGEPEVFLDPNKFSEDGTVSLASITFSKDHKYAAYSIARSGSDWNEIYVMNVATRQLMPDTLQWVKFSSATWQGDGFYYSRYDAPEDGKEYSNQNQFHKVYYHKLGTKQSEDQLTFDDAEHPLRYFFAQVSDDEQHLFVYGSEGTHGSEIYWKDLSNPSAKFQLLFKGFENNYSVIDNVGDKFWVLTDRNASHYRLIAVDPKNPEEANWEDVVSERDDLLQSASIVGGQLFTSYLKDASTRIYRASLDNPSQSTEVELPGIGSVNGFGGRREDTVTFFTFTSFTYPATIYKYDVTTGASTVFHASEAQINPEDYETKQVFYPSKDGTKIPMFIVHKKGIELDGNNPTFLYGYGGFNISLTPSFSITRMVFLENGGVFALANLRGGGEYGEDWHEAGMLGKKQNVFDDFIAAAEYLIAENYTSSDKLAIEGRSNGGLLVGACMTQRPDLYKVALPAVGVLDMLRYHKFTIGWGWAVEYGSSDSDRHFDWLYKYSPLHNVKNIAYPATMVLTADHDDRVVPAHSFKFLATLQEKHSGEQPILGRIDSKAGHGAGKPTAKVIEEWADIWSFVFWNLGMEPK